MPKWCAYSIRYTFSAIALYLCVPIVVVSQEPDHPPRILQVPQSHLTDNDILYVTKLVEAPPAAELPTYDYVSPPPSLKQLLAGNLVSSIDSVDDNDPATRLALVTTYNYQSNETTKILIDLFARKVIDERPMPGTNAPLSEIEKSVATRLVLNDRNIVDLLGAALSNVEVEMLLTRTEDIADRFYDKRVVVPLLRTPDGYLSTPLIFVNLSDLEVVIEDRPE